MIKRDHKGKFIQGSEAPNKIMSLEQCNSLNISTNKYFAYLLGVLCGDASILINKSGFSGKIKLSVKDKDFIKYFIYCCSKLSPKVTYFIDGKNMHVAAINSIELINYITKKYGYFRHKDWRIPIEIKNGSNRIIGNFLKGIYDSDGSFIGNSSITLQKINKHGMEDLSFLLNRLGIQHTLCLVNRKTVTGNDVYCIRITSTTEISKFSEKIGFTIGRKQIKLDAYLKGKPMITSTEIQVIKKLFKEGKSIYRITKSQPLPVDAVTRIINDKRPRGYICDYSFSNGVI